MDWMDIKHTRWLDMLRLNNRINNMPTNRWPKSIWQYDKDNGGNLNGDHTCVNPALRKIGPRTKQR